MRNSWHTTSNLQWLATWHTTWKRNQSLWLGCGVVGLLTWAVISGATGLRGLREKNEELRQLTAENEVLKRENGDLEQHVQRLATSPEEQELEIREQGGLKEGEVTLILPKGERPEDNKQEDKDGKSAGSQTK
jgi:hypothetical protein